MNISLTKHYNEFVEEKVKSGRYESRSEVIRAALRLMETSESQRDLLPYILDLEKKLLAGMQGPKRPLTKAVWQEIRSEMRRRQPALKK
jgi:antitoxin ParD1/3/4